MDERFRDRLVVHLSLLQRQGLISLWHDRRLQGGDDFAASISDKLEKADIFLPLVSADFLASTYCYDVEMQLALKRHDAGKMRIMPIIVRPCDWRSSPLARLLAVPKDGVPITKWADEDEAFLDVERTLRGLVEARTSAAADAVAPTATDRPAEAIEIPRIDLDKSAAGAWRRIDARKLHAPTQGLLFGSANGPDIRLFVSFAGETREWRRNESELRPLTKLDPTQREKTYLTMIYPYILFPTSKGEIEAYNMRPDCEGSVRHEFTLSAHRAKPALARFDESANRLLTADIDGEVVVWDWESRTAISRLHPLHKPVAFMDLSLTSNVAVTSRDGHIEIFDLLSSRSLKILKADIAGICGGYFSGSDKYIVADDEAGRREVFDAKTGTKLPKNQWSTVAVQKKTAKNTKTSVVTTADGTVWIAEPTARSKDEYVPVDMLPSAMKAWETAISDNAEFVALAMDKTELHVWERKGPAAA